jgi:hypothetical protein
MFRASLSALLFAAAVVAGASAQQVNTGVTQTGVGDSFHETFGTAWSVRGRGWFANFGGGTPGVAPPFGMNGGGGLSGGFGFGGGGVSGNLRFVAQQGSTRSIGSTSGSVTSLNGYPSYFFHGTQRPFITQITPVVGTPPIVVTESPLAMKLRQAGGPGGLGIPYRREETPLTFGDNTPPAPGGLQPGGLQPTGSSAERGDLSVAEIRRRQAEADAVRGAELDRLLEEAERLEAEGDARGAANIYSRLAAKVEGAEREAVLNRARQLRAASKE